MCVVWKKLKRLDIHMINLTKRCTCSRSWMFKYMADCETKKVIVEMCFVESTVLPIIPTQGKRKKGNHSAELSKDLVKVNPQGFIVAGVIRILHELVPDLLIGLVNVGGQVGG